jgi:hypothetical protein
LAFHTGDFGTANFAQGIIDLRETQQDFTTFAGNRTGSGVNVSDLYPGFVIDAILSDSQDTLETVDVPLTSNQMITMNSDELVSNYNIRGDSNGNDQPSVTLSFNPVTVRLRPV